MSSHLGYKCCSPCRNLVLAIQVGVEVPSEALGRVIKAKLFVEAVHLLYVLWVQFEVRLQIRFDTALCLTLRDNTPSCGKIDQLPSIRINLGLGEEYSP